MARPGEQAALGRELDDLSEIHDGDAVGDVAHHREIMGDEDVGEAELALEVLHQVDDLRLDRYVERRHRLVTDDQLGLRGQRAGDADALALTTREFVRIAQRMPGRQADLAQQLVDAPAQRRARRQPMQAQRFGQRLADGEARVQRGVGILEDDLHVAAQVAQRAAGQATHVAAGEADRALGGLDQAQYQAAGRRLAAARFPHQRQRLARRHVEGKAVDRAHGTDGTLEDDAALYREVLGEAGDGEEGLGGHSAASARTRSSGAFQQAARWPGAISRKVGCSARHFLSASAQRGLKRQPGGRA